MAITRHKILIPEFQESGRNWAVCIILRLSTQELVFQIGGHEKAQTYRFQEDSFGEPIQKDGDPAKQPFYEFKLPQDDYSDMMFAKRLASDGPSSPPLLAHQFSGTSVEGARVARRYSTVDDTDGMHPQQYAWNCACSSLSRSPFIASINQRTKARAYYSYI